MTAFSSPSFTDLDMARAWVYQQSLDEPCYLVRIEFFMPDNGKHLRWVHYEFYSLDEMNTYGGQQHFDIVEVWE